MPEKINLLHKICIDFPMINWSKYRIFITLLQLLDNEIVFINHYKRKMWHLWTIFLFLCLFKLLISFRLFYGKTSIEINFLKDELRKYKTSQMKFDIRYSCQLIQFIFKTLGDCTKSINISFRIRNSMSLLFVAL